MESTETMPQNLCGHRVGSLSKGCTKDVGTLRDYVHHLIVRIPISNTSIAQRTGLVRMRAGPDDVLGQFVTVLPTELCLSLV